MPKSPALSPRLSAIAALVPPGAVVADVGCNHAWLGAALIYGGRSPRVIGLENKPAPLALAQRMAAAVGPALEIRASDGLGAVQPGEVDAIVIAGMGAALILRLIEAAPAVVGGARRLILQPERSPDGLRLGLHQLGYGFVEEQLIPDGGQRHLILAVERGAGRRLACRADAQLGPVLRARRDPALVDALRDRLAAQAQAIAQIEAASATHPGLRRARITAALIRRALRQLGASSD